MNPLRIVLALCVLIPCVEAHGEPHSERAASDLLIDTFEGPQDGPLVIVPMADALAPCTLPVTSVKLAFAEGSGTMGLAATNTDLLIAFDVPPSGFTAIAIDTNDITRTLLLMQEHLVIRHALAARIEQGEDIRWRVGELGIPVPAPGSAPGHVGIDAAAEGGPRLYYDSMPANLDTCELGDPGHFSLLLDRAEFGGALAPGSVVHIVALHDALPMWIPRPLDGSTAVLQANLYLVNEGEDPATVRRALAGEVEIGEVIPPVMIVAGVAALMWTRRSQ